MSGTSPKVALTNPCCQVDSSGPHGVLALPPRGRRRVILRITTTLHVSGPVPWRRDGNYQPARTLVEKLVGIGTKHVFMYLNRQSQDGFVPGLRQS